MTPETKARQLIDQKLEQAGWVIQDMKQLNLAAGMGVAVREYPTDSGPADYVLFVGRHAVGVIEAKKDSAGENLTVTENQTERYATANLKWRKDNTPLRFLFEATGQIIRFTDNADPAPRSREIFHFFKPETLAAWLAQTESLRRRLAAEGKSYQGVKDALRRDAAIHLLLTPNLTLEVVAQQVGFSETSTFHRAFKKWTGVTPGLYRQLHGQHL